MTVTLCNITTADRISRFKNWSGIYLTGLTDCSGPVHN